MATEHERPDDEDAVASTTPKGDVPSVPEEDEVSGYVMSVPQHLDLDAGGEEDEVQT